MDINNRFTLKELTNMETISQGHTDNLKFESNYIRVWLSRMTTCDGMPYNNQVTIEVLTIDSLLEVEHGWVIKKQYQAR